MKALLIALAGLFGLTLQEVSNTPVEKPRYKFCGIQSSAFRTVAELPYTHTATMLWDRDDGWIELKQAPQLVYWLVHLHQDELGWVTQVSYDRDRKDFYAMTFDMDASQEKDNNPHPVKDGYYWITLDD